MHRIKVGPDPRCEILKKITNNIITLKLKKVLESKLAQSLVQALITKIVNDRGLQINKTGPTTLSSDQLFFTFPLFFAAKKSG